MSSRYKSYRMDSSVPVFEPEDKTPVKPRRGVTVVTAYGRAVTFGMPRERVERMAKAVAQKKGNELTAVMQEHKAAQLQKARSTASQRR